VKGTARVLGRVFDGIEYCPPCTTGRSMGPKAEACIRFVTASGRPAAIGALTDAAGILAGRAGTTIRAARPGRGQWPGPDSRVSR
jgi:hypothetical protein